MTSQVFQNTNNGSTALRYDDTSANNYVVTLPHKSCTLLGNLLEASVTPVVNSSIELQLTSNTSLTIKVKGTDGVVRSVSLTLA